MKKEELFEILEDIDENYISEAKNTVLKKKRHTWRKWVAFAACLCLIIAGSINTLLRFDYLKAGCSTWPGKIVDEAYYYNVPHSGVWRYSTETGAEKVLSAYWEDGWSVNEYGLFYKQGRTLYKMDLDTGVKQKLYTANINKSTHIGFDLQNDGNVIVTVYNKNTKIVYQVLIDGTTGEELKTLMEPISYNSQDDYYSRLHIIVGERKIDLIKIDEVDSVIRYDLCENGQSILPANTWVGTYSSHIGEALAYWYYTENTIPEDCSRIILFPDGTNLVFEKVEKNYTDTIGKYLLYVDGPEDAEKGGGIDAGIWCYDPVTKESWQLKNNVECDFYEFTTDGKMLYSCVPWNKKQTVWEIEYESEKPVSLHLINEDINK